jgi:hypothetical protein
MTPQRLSLYEKMKRGQRIMNEQKTISTLDKPPSPATPIRHWQVTSRLSDNE